jgi:BirA family biotin operon repressor/biotin-[acetyl-CoA-carboxylase] ligase
MDRASLLDALQTDRFGRVLRVHDKVGSTNTEAAAWARGDIADPTPEGAVVLTEFQTAGRGRHGRSWSADSGRNLMLSVVLRPKLPPEQFGRITIAAGVAVADTVAAFVEPQPVTIKWPNDVLLAGKKTCGMLLETSFGANPDQPSGGAVILGIGLNVNQTDFPPDLDDTATSMRLATGRLLPRPTVFAKLLAELEARYDAVCATAAVPGDVGPVHAAYEDRLDRRGELVTLRFAGTDRTVSGYVRGITKDGALRLAPTPNAPAAEETVLHAGEVTSRG